MLPLDGLIVLDLSRLLPGPYCSLVLADLGARVLKIEEPNTGDYLRWIPPFWIAGKMSAAFAALNRNKESFVLDLKREPKTLLALAEKADVLIESFRPGVLAKLGLPPSLLRERNPRLVVCSITGYGQTGPLKDKAGHDLNYLARAGVLGGNARRGDRPHPLPVQVADLAAGALFPATAILAALYAREKTGQGAHIDASMTDGAAALQPFTLATWASTGTVGAPGEDTLQGGVPCYNIYPTKDDRYLAVGALEPKFWQRFCALMNAPEWLASGLLQGEAGARVWRELAARFRKKTLAEWSVFFADADCCVEPVLEPSELQSDPQLSARGMFLMVPQGDRDMPQMRTPIFFVGAAPRAARPAPELGANSAALRKEFALPG